MVQVKYIIFIGILFIFGMENRAYCQDPVPPLGSVFTDTEVPRIDILLPADSLALIFSPGNEESNYHFHGTFIFHSSFQNDTLPDVGFRLRGNTSRFAKKKSFKVSFNTYVPGREYFGLEKLNLNGEHNDPSVIRSKLGWDLLRSLGIPAPRSNHVALYINNIYFGLYINVEHIDEEFVLNRFGNKNGNLYKCLWPADLNYLGDDPNLYKYEAGNRRAYDLRTNNDTDNYSDLANFIFILNQIPDNDEFACAIDEVFNLDAYLKVIAFDLATGNWDGPIFNKNNFYLYNNTITGKFEYIPYDLDNTLGIDWIGINWAYRDIYNWSPSNESRPIYERILDHPEYRDRFSFYFNEFLNESFSATSIFARIDSVKLMITPFAEADSFRTLDYGYDIPAFHNSYSAALSGHVQWGLKPYITQRRNSAFSQLIINNIFPVIHNVENNFPDLNEPIIFRATVLDENSTMLTLNYQIEQDQFQQVQMFDDGMHQDGSSLDGVFGIEVPGISETANISYYIEAIDMLSQLSRDPVCDVYSFTVGQIPPLLYINEFMADNNNIIADEYGEFDDWIEIYNGSTEEIWLGNKYLTDNFNQPNRWLMPQIYIQPEEFLLIWADDQSFQGDHHCNFKLSKSGEHIGIFTGPEMGYYPIDTLSFGIQIEDISMGRLPNGTGANQYLSIPSPGASNETATSVEIPVIQEFSLYPNPASESFTIEFNLPETSIVSLNLFDPYGKLISQYEASFATGQQSFKFNLDKTLSKGLYFISFQTSSISGMTNQPVFKKLLIH